MLIISGADVVLPDRIVPDGRLVVDRGRIVAIESAGPADLPGATLVDARDSYVVPGFIDVHVHGVAGFDTLDEGDPITEMASRLPQFGVTGFCPTSVACAPEQLRTMLRLVGRVRAAPLVGARVLPAHLESNFINPEYRGAQPAECLRVPGSALSSRQAQEDSGSGQAEARHDFSGRDILAVIAESRPDVGVVTLASEMPGGLDLVRALVAAGHQVSLGHSGASWDEAMDAIDAGARRATHLFNRMTPMTHRAPGVAGAVLSRHDVAAELICDGYHVHPAMCRVAIAAKGVDRIMAITDGTSGSGLQPGASARLGGRRIRITDSAAVLDDGTLAGSTLTMDRAFLAAVVQFGLSIVEASIVCSTTPARELGLTGIGAIARDAVADLTVLDRGFRVRRTFVDGEERYRAGATA